jgi:hypothetical protein
MTIAGELQLGMSAGIPDLAIFLMKMARFISDAFPGCAVGEIQSVGARTG